MTPIKIAILGGGPAALATAFELTSEANWRERYRIDVYQMGWRLGGKCASSRNRGARGRNEEHGLHVLGGFYHNTFGQLDRLYAEWARVSPTTAIPYDEAFAGHDRFTLMQSVASGWVAMDVDLPRNAKRPGADPEAMTSLGALLRMAPWVSGLVRGVADQPPPGPPGRRANPPHPDDAPNLLSSLAARAAHLGERLAEHPRPNRATTILEQIHDHLRAIEGAFTGLFPHDLYPGPDMLGVVELGVAMLRGFIDDKLFDRGFDSINDMDALQWLASHGATARALACPLVTSSYHYAFAYEDGDAARPNIAAGVGLRGLLRMVFEYHGSVFMHMRGGMGEVFAAPYYEVLRSRGVRFHFFHRVEDLIPGDDGRIAEIRLRVQAAVEGGSDAYQPLFEHRPDPDARPRRAWPEAPMYDQLAEGVRPPPDQLDKLGAGSEVGVTKTLKVDADFDLCVVAMSVGALRLTTSALAGANPAWKAMLDHAGVAPTMAAQIWRREPVSSFGGLRRDGLLTGYRPPLDTWGDMSFLIPLEEAGAGGERPGSLSYFCGPITAGRACDLPGRPERETQAWLDSFAAYPFPGLADADGSYRRAGELERYVRINDDPADLYVISPKDSIDKRLRTDESGFHNMMLAGDWTRNNFDCGSVETAVASGRQCARAISGLPAVIPGESDFA